MKSRILIGLWNFIFHLDIRVIFHGLQAESPAYWRDQIDRERAAYAKFNSWVLAYDFGHKELIERFRHEIKVI